MKLLYAEDERSLSEAVVDILTYHKYIVDAVYNGEDALNDPPKIVHCSTSKILQDALMTTLGVAKRY